MVVCAPHPATSTPFGRERTKRGEASHGRGIGGARRGRARDPRLSGCASRRVDECGSRRHERLPERQVEVDRPGRRTLRGRERAARNRAPGRARTLDRFRRPWIAEPANRVAVQLGLVDRLTRAGVAELRRPVGGAHEHRHPGVRGLDHRGMEVGRGGPRRAQQDRGDARGESDPECAKRSRPFVEHHMHPDSCVPRQREGERCRPRPGRDNCVGAAAPGPLVDERPSEGRGRVDLGHRSATMVGCRSCSYRASRRR